MYNTTLHKNKSIMLPLMMWLNCWYYQTPTCHKGRKNVIELWDYDLIEAVGVHNKNNF